MAGRARAAWGRWRELFRAPTLPRAEHEPTDNPPARAPCADHVEVWDCRTGLADLVVATVSATAPDVRRSNPVVQAPGPGPTHVLLLPVTDDPGEDAHELAHALTRGLFLATRHPGRPFRLVLGWVVPRESRHLVWTPEDDAGAHRNDVLLTLASAWPRALRRMGSVEATVDHLSERTQRLVQDVRQTTLLMPPSAGHLLRYVEQLDPSARYVLLCQALGSDGWHGLEALGAATRLEVAR